MTRNNPLYTIGHGTRKSEIFLDLLKQFGIEYLIDVRSIPHSRFNPQYNKKILKAFLEQNGIRYVFMGDALGGRPKDPSCYDADGKVNYDKIKTKDFFHEGIERLKTAYQKNLTVAIMCSESKPQECHRSKLIGDVLDSDNIFISHIDETGQLKDHSTVINSIKNKRSKKGLSGDI